MIYIPGANRLYAFLLKYCRKFYFMGKGVTIAPSCEIRRGASRYISIGNNVKLAQDVWLNVPFEIKSDSMDGPVVRIGDGTIIGRRCMITGLNKIEIGSNVLFGPGVLVVDHSHEFRDLTRPIMDQGVTQPGSVIIEDGCWFGHNSAIVANNGRQVRLGRNCTVGANAVVTQSFPAGSVLVGVPARNVAGNAQS